MNAPAGNSSSTAVPARLQKVSPWRTKPNTRAWNGTIHASPAITHAKSCERMKLHCWVCAAFVTASCIGRALPRDRMALVRGGHIVIKPDRTSQATGGVMGVTGPLRLAQNAHERLIIWRAG